MKRNDVINENFSLMSNRVAARVVQYSTRGGILLPCNDEVLFGDVVADGVGLLFPHRISLVGRKIGWKLGAESHWMGLAIVHENDILGVVEDEAAAVAITSEAKT